MTRNLTLAVDDKLLADYRLLAAESRTTVNAMIRKHMEEAIGRKAKRRAAIDRMLELSRESEAADAARAGAGAPVEDWRWSREDTYAERLDRWPKGA